MGDITNMPGIKMVAIKEGALPMEEPNPEAAITSYTIIKVKEVQFRQ